jgi:hypothetical protein
MSAEQYYSIRSKQVINETLDNETIIINLETGVYYSLNPTATLVWKGLIAGISIHSIAAELQTRHPETPDVAAAVQKFITFIAMEQLIEATVAGTSDVEKFKGEVAAAVGAFVSPTIEKYEDMQEMLLADPIHEVEKDGWPKLKK